jgi:hypothetical protein
MDKAGVEPALFADPGFPGRQPAAFLPVLTPPSLDPVARNGRRRSACEAAAAAGQRGHQPVRGRDRPPESTSRPVSLTGPSSPRRLSKNPLTGARHERLTHETHEPPRPAPRVTARGRPETKKAFQGIALKGLGVRSVQDVQGEGLPSIRPKKDPGRGDCPVLDVNRELINWRANESLSPHNLGTDPRFVNGISCGARWWLQGGTPVDLHAEAASVPRPCPVEARRHKPIPGNDFQVPACVSRARGTRRGTGRGGRHSKTRWIWTWWC